MDKQPEVRVEPVELQYIVMLKAGSMAGLQLRYPLDKTELNYSVAQTIEYGLKLNVDRAKADVQMAVKKELEAPEKTITVNGNARSPRDSIKDLFVEKIAPKESIKYMALDIVVAAQATGGF